MADGSGQGYGVILLTFLGAYLLAVVPMPQWLLWARPEWVALTLVYWVIALPHRVGIASALLLGVGLDLLEGALLGQNAFALVVVATLSQVLYQRLRLYSLWQQSSVIFVLVGINQLICQWVQNLQGVGAQSLLFLLPAVSSALLWPVILLVLRSLRRTYRVT
ncbi:MAG: rod shape-determining protein MreD [Halioglobus sp.]|nr:rod shape-determining protein MreD [Halioglobus sp.]